jgi:hypothetical protein
MHEPEIRTLFIVYEYTVLQILFCRGNVFYGSYEILVSIHSSCHLSVCIRFSSFRLSTVRNLFYQVSDLTHYAENFTHEIIGVPFYPL